MMRSQEVKETSSITKDVFPPLRAESLTSGTLSLESTVDEAETWARKLFPDVNKSIQVPTEMSSKASKKIKPDNQAKKTVKTEEFSSNSTAQEMMNDTVIPGLFVENLKNSKRAKRAKKFKVMRLQQKVLQ